MIEADSNQIGKTTATTKAMIDSVYPKGKITVTSFEIQKLREENKRIKNECEILRNEIEKFYDANNFVKEIKARNAELVEALEFYADEGVWNWHYCKKPLTGNDKTRCYAVADEINFDAGELARKALKTNEGGE